MRSMIVPAAWILITPAADAGVIGADALCPSAIDTRQQAVHVPADYQAGSYPGIYVLQDIAFSDGPPGEQGAMQPQDVKGEAGSAISKTWYFPKRKDRGPIFLSCIYDNTTVTLVREIEPEVTKCVVTYNAEVRVGGYPQVTGSYCTASNDLFW